MMVGATCRTWTSGTAVWEALQTTIAKITRNQMDDGDDPLQLRQKTETVVWMMFRNRPLPAVGHLHLYQTIHPSRSGSRCYQATIPA